MPKKKTPIQLSSWVHSDRTVVSASRGKKSSAKRLPVSAGTSRRTAAVADGNQHVAQEPRMTDALDRRGREQGAEAILVELHQVGERGRAQIVARGELHLVRRGRKLVPRADREAVVAAIDTVTHGGAELERDRPPVLDVEVAEATPRIEPERGGKGLRRADVEAARAGAAALRLRRIDRQLGRGEDGAQEQPRAELARDQYAVLALPAEAGSFRQRLFHHRGGVDENLHLVPGPALEQTGDFLEPALDELVIVPVARIDRDGAAVPVRENAERIVRRPVFDPEHDDGADVRPEPGRLGALAWLVRKPVHVAVPAFGQRRLELGPEVGPGGRRG